MEKKFIYTKQELDKAIPALVHIKNAANIAYEDFDQFSKNIDKELIENNMEDYNQHPSYKQLIKRRQKHNDIISLYDLLINYFLYENNIYYDYDKCLQEGNNGDNFIYYFKPYVEGEARTAVDFGRTITNSISKKFNKNNNK